jgi:hypothetical protein
MMLIVVQKPYGKVTQTIFVKIFDLNDKEKEILDCEIFDETLKGILISGNYVIVDGHIYFKNNVIKIRYDLMKRFGINGADEKIYFNQYEEILQLNKNDIIKTNTPLDSIQSHKLAFVILNNHELAPKQLLILPYLHERKIYLNRIKKNTKYFYTTSQSGDSDSKIFAINLTESKYYIYSEKGLLLNRVKYLDLTKKYGEIVSTSANGLNFVLWNKSVDQVTILRFSESKVSYIKSIKLTKSIIEFVKK